LLQSDAFWSQNVGPTY